MHNKTLLFPELSVSIAGKLKKINDYRWFLVKMLQVSEPARLRVSEPARLRVSEPARLRVNETLNLDVLYTKKIPSVTGRRPILYQIATEGIPAREKPHQHSPGDFLS